jgi:hypothetical protein
VSSLSFSSIHADAGDNSTIAPGCAHSRLVPNCQWRRGRLCLG